MYEFHQDKLSVPAKVIYQELQLCSYDMYKKKCISGKIVRTKEGRGKDNQAFVSLYDLNFEYKNAVINYLGNPENVTRNILENYIVTDLNAVKFLAAHRRPNGKPLSAQEQKSKATSIAILNAIKTVFDSSVVANKMFGKKKTQIWLNVSEAVNALTTIKTNNDKQKWIFKLPGNARTLQRKYQEYLKYGYSTFIHKGEGNKHSIKITKVIGDFLLAQYCLPNKLSIPEVLERYNFEKIKRGWSTTLTNGGIYNFLYRPENERIWTLARHGKESYNKKYKHTLSRDRSNWFPNAYWAIDGTKLDWIHFWDDSSNKMGAKLKIDVMFDVYSEKIIGWDISFTESHIEHFKTIKMAVNEAGCRPYYLTYDNQGGHKMDRMKELYNSLVAVNGGVHHPNKAKEHNNPVEGLFNRLQKQVINKFWFSDGQSITVKRDDNKMNTDFILANKSSLKTIDELLQAWETAVNIWNNKQHPSINGTRNEVYNHEMPMREELSLYDIMTKMWIDQKKRPITYKPEGLKLVLNGKKYIFEVYDKDGNIDLEFRRTSVGKKFIVRYDPDFLDGYIQLLEYDENKNLIHVANAEPKRLQQNIPVLMKDGDKEQWYKDNQVKELEFERDLKAYQELMQRTNITPQTLIDDQDLLIKFKGDLAKFERSKLEADENLTNAASIL